MLTAEQRHFADENDVKSTGTFTKHDRAKLIMLLLVIGVLCVAGVVSTAYATQIKYNLNEINKQNIVIQGEIDNLNVIIQEENNVAKIEDKAINLLGMVYPSYDQIVYIAEDSQTINNFASVLREQAYN
jgi:cell division protein FtsL